MKNNGESRALKIREMVLNVLNDGKIHNAREIINHVVEKNIVSDSNTDVIYNVLFHMKRKGLIASGPEKAQYVLPLDEIDNKLINNEEEKKLPINLNTDKYLLLKPSLGRYSRMTLMVKENGELRMNGTLMKEIKERNIEIFVSKDVRTVILNPGGGCAHKFTKAGTTKNKELVSMLKKIKVKLPIFYEVKWNDSIGAWEGVMENKI